MVMYVVDVGAAFRVSRLSSAVGFLEQPAWRRRGGRQAVQTEKQLCRDDPVSRIATQEDSRQSLGLGREGERIVRSRSDCGRWGWRKSR